MLTLNSLLNASKGYVWPAVYFCNDGKSIGITTQVRVFVDGIPFLTTVTELFEILGREDHNEITGRLLTGFNQAVDNIRSHPPVTDAMDQNRGYLFVLDEKYIRQTIKANAIKPNP